MRPPPRCFVLDTYREVEAFRERVRRVTLDHESRTAAWLFALIQDGCRCTGSYPEALMFLQRLSPDLCPFHSLALLVQGKSPGEPVFTDREGNPPSAAGQIPSNKLPHSWGCHSATRMEPGRTRDTPPEPWARNLWQLGE